MSKRFDGIVRVVHTHGNSSAVEFEQVVIFNSAVFGGVHHLYLSGLCDDEIFSFVLISVRVPSNDDGFDPSGYQLGNGLANDRFTEHGTTEDVTDGSVGTQPHLFEFELFDPLLVGSDCGAFDTDVVF